MQKSLTAQTSEFLMDDIDLNPVDDEVYVEVYTWNRSKLFDEIPEDISEESIDEILNGQNEVLDRKYRKPTWKNLLQRYGLDDEEVYLKKIDVFHNDQEKMMPIDAIERDIDQPLQLHNWKKEVDDYQGEKKKYRHNYLGYVPDNENNEIVFHMQWTELEEKEEDLS